MTQPLDALDEMRKEAILSTWWDFTREDMVELFTRLGITAEKATALWKLTSPEFKFVQLVERNPGCKLQPPYEGYAEHEIQTPWKNPEKLGLIHCVGSYKWEPGPKPGYPEPTPETHPR